MTATGNGSLSAGGMTATCDDENQVKRSTSAAGRRAELESGS